MREKLLNLKPGFCWKKKGKRLKSVFLTPEWKKFEFNLSNSSSGISVQTFPKFFPGVSNSWRHKCLFMFYRWQRLWHTGWSSSLPIRRTWVRTLLIGGLSRTFLYFTVNCPLLGPWSRYMSNKGMEEKKWFPCCAAWGTIGTERVKYVLLLPQRMLLRKISNQYSNSGHFAANH